MSTGGDAGGQRMHSDISPHRHYEAIDGTDVVRFEWLKRPTDIQIHFMPIHSGKPMEKVRLYQKGFKALAMCMHDELHPLHQVQTVHAVSWIIAEVPEVCERYFALDVSPTTESIAQYLVDAYVQSVPAHVPEDKKQVLPRYARTSLERLWPRFGKKKGEPPSSQ